MHFVNQLRRAFICLVILITLFAKPVYAGLENPPTPILKLKKGTLQLLSQVGGAVMDVALHNGYAYIGKGQRLVSLNLAQEDKLELVGSSVNLPDIIQAVAVNGDYAYVADGGGGLRILNISTPDFREVGKLDTWATGIAIIEQGQILLTDGDFRLIDVNDPTQPNEISFLSTKGFASAVTVYNHLALVADGDTGITLIDIQNVQNPIVLSSLALEGYAYNASIVSINEVLFAFVACGAEGGVRIIDLSDLTHPKEVASLDTQGSAHDVQVQGSIAYIANGDGGLQTANITNPERPILQAQLDVVGYALSLSLLDSTLYLADGASLLSIDISDSMNPKSKASYEVLGSAYSVAITQQAVQGSERTYAYVTDYYSGMLVLDISQPEQRPTVTGFFDAQANSQNIALITLPNKASPSTESPLPLSHKPYALLGTASTGLHILDITSPYYPSLLSSIETPDIVYQTAAQESGIVYLADGSSGGLRIIDLSQAQEPLELGTYSKLDYTRGVAVFPYDITSSSFSVLDSTQTIAAVADGTSGVRFLDVTHPEAVTQLSVIDTPGFAESVKIEGAYAFVADGQEGGIRVIDIKDLRKPQEVAAYPLAGYALDLIITQNKLYLANGEDGLRIFDISNPTLPNEIGAYKQAGFTSGVAVQGDTIYCANRAAGLLVLRLQPAKAQIFNVNSTSDEIDAIFGDGRCESMKKNCTLRAAIQEANANPGVDTIILPKGIYNLTIPGTDEEKSALGDLDITDHLILRGESSSQTVIDGGSLERVFHILGDGSLWVSMANLTIQNGLSGVNINNAASYSLTDSEISGNQGYGLWAFQSSISLKNVVVKENEELRYMGGVGGSASSFTIENSTIAYNQGAVGGISIDGKLSLINSTINENYGTNGVGGIWINGVANISNSTIIKNQGVGLAADDGSKVQIKGSLIQQNTNMSDCKGTITSLGYNLIGSSNGFITERKEGDIIGTEAEMTIEKNNMTVYLPSQNSLIIDHIPSQQCTDIEGQPLLSDQRNQSRPQDGNQDGNPACDIGAIEVSSK